MITDPEVHKMRHHMLYMMLDELVADYLWSERKMASELQGIPELLRWAKSEADAPTSTTHRVVPNAELGPRLS